MREEICQLVLCHTNLVVPWTHQSNCTNASWMRKKCLFEIRHYRKISCPRRSTTCIHTYGAWSSLPQKISQVFLGATWCDPLFQLIYLLLNRPCPRSKKGSKTRNNNKQQQIGKDKQPTWSSFCWTNQCPALGTTCFTFSKRQKINRHRFCSNRFLVFTIVS